MPYSDGPPWTIGQNCNATLQLAAVNANVATGVFVKPDTYRISYPRTWYRGTNTATPYPATVLPAGKAVLEGAFVCRDALLMADGTPSTKTAAQRLSTIVAYWGAYIAAPATPITWRDFLGYTWSVDVEELEIRAVDGGRYYGAGSEVRFVFLQAP
jgi:hypothetical protein